VSECISKRGGTPNAYFVDGCRCAGCKAACASYARRRRAERRAATSFDAIPHGLRGYESYLCRCDVCRDAGAVKNVKHRKSADELRQYFADYFQANRDRHAANGKAWRDRNQERYRTQSVRRRARRRALVAAADVRLVTDRDWRRLVNRHGGRCAYCGASEKLTVEHIVPIFRGGRHAIGNLLPVCGRCNSSKGPRLLIEWRARRSQNV